MTDKLAAIVRDQAEWLELNGHGDGSLNPQHLHYKCDACRRLKIMREALKEESLKGGSK